MKHISNKQKLSILNQYYSGVSPAEICQKYGIPPSTLFYWISKSKVKEQKVPTRKTLPWDKLRAHTAKLEAELAFLQRTIVDNYTLRERMDIIDKEYGLDSIHVQCEALKVARGTYLNHRLHNKNDTAWFKRREAEYTEIITRIHEESGHVYGPKKITAIMHKQGKPVSDRYVRKLMIENGLSSVRSPFNKNYAYVSRHLREASHASQDFKVDRINQVWVSDTSAILEWYHFRTVAKLTKT